MYMPHVFLFRSDRSVCKHIERVLSESSVAVQMQGGCVSAHAAVIATVQAPAICHRAIAMLCSSGACWSMAMLCSSGACWSMAYFLE